MALFHVKRFMGDEEEIEEDKSLKAENILKRLQAEAEAKRSGKLEALAKDSVNSGKEISARDKTLNDSLIKNKDSHTEDDKVFQDFHKHKHRTDFGKIEIQEEGDDTDSHKHKHKKKKKKYSESISVEELESEVTESEGHKKKKKKKRKHNETENLTDNLDSRDIHDDKIGGSQSTEDLSPHKKRKRHKDEQSEPKTVSDSKKEDRGEVKYDKHKKKKEEKTAEDASGGNQDEENEIENVVINEELKDESDELQGDAETHSEDKPGEIGGFTVIGSYKKTKLEKVKRVLPDWLANPSVISADLKKNQTPVEDMPGLDRDLVDRLLQNNITNFFPVQMQVIPSLLESISTGFHIGRAGYQPSDICVSAPTGSGKTLAFVLPIVQALRHRVTREIRALAVLPVRDLATQVFKVFQTYTEGSNLKVGLLVGQKIFSVEQQSLVKKRLRGYQCMYDIIVATPGRLVDHINKTEGFDLTHLRFLVIDEADRVMGEIKQDWLIQVENAVYKNTSQRPLPGPLTVASCRNMVLPLQKLLYSATLSSNPEKLQQLNLFHPKLFTSVVMATEHRKQPSQNAEKAEETVREDTEKKEEKTDSVVRGEFVGKFTTPAGLSEFYIAATSAEKPLIVLYLLHHLKFRSVLCFTNSLEATHRLFWIIKLVGGIEVKEFSSKRHSMQRDKILKKFQAGKIDIIICSDAMARGMDIDNVKYVISYDPPPYIKTYVHRIGRTARAGKVGSAITLLQKKEFFHFKKMVRESGKSNIKAMKITKKSLKPLIPNFQQALQELPDILKREKHS